MPIILKIVFISWLISGCDHKTVRSGDQENTTGYSQNLATSLPPGAATIHSDYLNPDFTAVSGNDLEQAIRSIPEFSSFILYRDGEIISEMYNNGGAANRPANIKSASKSILSALTGIALREGFIESIDDPVSGYLPANFDGIDDSLKHQITIRHLLMMNSGLRSTSFGNYGAWVVSRDWVGHAIRGPQVHPPGRSMAYSTGDTHILSAVLSEASGMSTRQLAERYLFTPMNQRIGGWDRDPQGYFFGGNNMALSPYALLEFGKLYLNGGMYNGVQVLDPEWIHKSLTTYQHGISFNSRRHDYGYLWWHNTFGGHSVWFAWGYGGQYLFLIPEMDAVIVLTGNPDTRSRGMNNRIYTIMETTVIPYLAGSIKRD
jgi:CubicO group peptidase (beta-lactamase class C family)